MKLIYQAVTATAHLTNESDFENFTPVFECDLPNNKLYEFNGSVQLTTESEKYVLCSVVFVIVRSEILKLVATYIKRQHIHSYILYISALLVCHPGSPNYTQIPISPALGGLDL